MNKYSVTLSETAEKQLNKLPDPVAMPIIKMLQKLGDDPRPHGSIKLKKQDGL